MTKIYNKADFNFFFDFDFLVWKLSTVTLIGLFIYYLLNPEKFEKLIAILSKFFKFLSKKFDYSYVKYDLQGTINHYLKKIKVEWIDVSSQTESEYIQNGEMILRLKKGTK